MLGGVQGLAPLEKVEKFGRLIPRVLNTVTNLKSLDVTPILELATRENPPIGAFT